jgi:hypothetical protein
MAEVRVMRSARSIGVLALGCFSALSGCSDGGGKDTGVLVVPYELGNRRDCAELEIVAVRADLDDGSFSEETGCEAGELRFNLLEPGRYDVVLYGLDEDGVEVMDSLADGPLPVDVVGGGTTVIFDPAIKLTAAPAKLDLRWDLGFGSCESAAIGSFGVVAWRGDGSDLLMETELDCETPGEGAGQYRRVPDEERELAGEELGEVEVQAYDENGIAMGEPVTFLFESPGAGGKVQLSLRCDEGGCRGSGSPD